MQKTKLPLHTNEKRREEVSKFSPIENDIYYVKGYLPINRAPKHHLYAK